MKAKFEKTRWCIISRYQIAPGTWTPWNFHMLYEGGDKSKYIRYPTGFRIQQEAKDYLKDMPRGIAQFRIVKAKITVEEI
jgi:hypothetical protein